MRRRRQGSRGIAGNALSRKDLDIRGVGEGIPTWSRKITQSDRATKKSGKGGSRSEEIFYLKGRLLYKAGPGGKSANARSPGK